MTSLENNFKESAHTEIIINQQIERIKADPQFAGSDILKRFLSFVVSETLGGRSHTIKEYTIAIKVLDKPVDFNPQHDAIVRIHAGRLRRALHQYYKGAGASDALCISMPKGSYLPVFEHPANNVASLQVAGNIVAEQPLHKPICLAVLPFSHYDNNSSRVSFSDGVGELLSTELSRFEDISVISYYTMRKMPEETIDAKLFEPALGVQYAIAGNSQFQGGNLRINVELIDVRSSEQIWSQMYEYKFNARNLFAIQDDIAKQVIAVLGDYCGLIVRHMAKTSGLKKPDREVSSAILWYYHFHSEFTPEAFEMTLEAIEAAVTSEPDYALAWGFLSELYLNAYLFNHSIKGNAIEQGLKFARKAVQLDPHCQNAYVALALAYAYLHDKKKCAETIEHCIALNPNAVTLIGMAGFLLICIGEHERGFPLLKRSLKSDRFYPPWFNGGIALYHFIHRDYEQAYYWAEKMNLPQLGWDYLLCASALGHLNRVHEAKAKIKGLVARVPDFRTTGRDYISAFILNEELTDILFEGLKLAGIPMLTVA